MLIISNLELCATCNYQTLTIQFCVSSTQVSAFYFLGTREEGKSAEKYKIKGSWQAIPKVTSSRYTEIALFISFPPFCHKPNQY